MKLRYYMRGLGIGMLVTAVILTIIFRSQQTMSDADVVERARELGMEEKYQSGTLADMSNSQNADAADTAEAKKPEQNADTATADDGAAVAATTDAAAAVADMAEGKKSEQSTDSATTDAAAAADTAEAKKSGQGADSATTADAAAAADAAEGKKSGQGADSAATDAAADTAEAKKSGQGADSAATADAAAADSAETEKTEQKSDSGAATEFIVNSGEGSDTIAAHLAKAGIVKDGAAFDAFLCSKGYDRKLRAGRHSIPAGATDEQIAQALMEMPLE